MCTGTTFINSLLGFRSNNAFLSIGLKGCKKSRLLVIIVSQNTQLIGMKLGTLLEHVLLINFILIVFCMNILKGKKSHCLDFV